MRIICGKTGGAEGPVRDTVTDPEYLEVSLAAGGEFVHATKRGHNGQTNPGDIDQMPTNRANCAPSTPPMILLKTADRGRGAQGLSGHESRS